MKRKDLPILIGVGAVAALISMFIASAIFSPPPHHTKVPLVQSINSNFPDIKNDPAYQNFLNGGALDPTQPIQIGNTKNSVPFQ